MPNPEVFTESYLIFSIKGIVFLPYNIYTCAVFFTNQDYSVTKSWPCDKSWNMGSRVYMAGSNNMNNSDVDPVTTKNLKLRESKRNLVRHKTTF